MKNFSVKEKCMGLDRLATWDEVHCAMTFWSQGASEFGCPSGGHGDVKSDAQAESACFPMRDTSSSSCN